MRAVAMFSLLLGPAWLAALLATATPVLAGETDLDALAQSAQRLSWEQRFDEAIEIYERVLAKEPAHPLARIERAKVLSWARRYEESAEAFRELLADDPADVEARIGLGRVLSWAGHYEEARSEYEQVLAAHPEHPDALLGVAQTWAWSGDLARARPAYRAAAAAAEDPVYAELGLAYLDLWEGARASARRQAETLAARHPGDRDVAELLMAARRATAPWVSASWDQLDDSDRNLLTTTRLEAGTTLGWGPALRVAYADYDVRTAGTGGTIRSLQGSLEWVPRPRHSVEAMLGLDRLERSGLEDHDVTDWGLRWSLPLPSSWSGSVNARREPFRYSVPLIENRIVIDSYTLAAHGPVGEKWRLSGEVSRWDLSDDNRRHAAEAAVRRSSSRGEHTLQAGLNLRWLDWEQHLDTGYFDPSDFFAWGLVGRAFGPVRGATALDYDLSLELGLQSFDTAERRTSNDRYFLLVGRMGWQATDGLRVEAWADGGSYASQGAEDWRYTRVGLRFLHRFGMGRAR